MKSYARDVANQMRRLYQRREAQCAFDQPERRPLTRAHRDAAPRARLRRFEHRSAEVPRRWRGALGARVRGEAARRHLRQHRGHPGDPRHDPVRRLRRDQLDHRARCLRRPPALDTDHARPARRAWQTFGACGVPPEDDSLTFATVGIALLTAVAWFVTPVVVAATSTSHGSPRRNRGRSQLQAARGEGVMANSGDAQGAVCSTSTARSSTRTTTMGSPGTGISRARHRAAAVADPPSRGDGRRPARPGARRRRRARRRRATRSGRPTARSTTAWSERSRHSRERTSCSRPCTSAATRSCSRARLRGSTSTATSTCSTRTTSSMRPRRPTTSSVEARARPHPGREGEGAHGRAGDGGDSPWDIEAAQRAGLPCVALLTGGYSECELSTRGPRSSLPRSSSSAST